MICNWFIITKDGLTKGWKIIVTEALNIFKTCGLLQFKHAVGLQENQYNRDQNL